MHMLRYLYIDKAILKKTQVSRELFLSANVHQGDELFSIQSRGKQCAFIILSATHKQCAIISHCSSAWSQSSFTNALV